MRNADRLTENPRGFDFVQPITGLLPLVGNRAPNINPEHAVAWARWLATAGQTIPHPSSIQPSGLDGYLVAMSPDQRETILDGIAKRMVEKIRYESKNQSLPTTCAMESLYTRTYSPRTAQVLLPTFESMLLTLRQIGTAGFDMRSYSGWRTDYEMRHAQAEELHDAMGIIQLEQELSLKLQELYSTRRNASMLYAEQQQLTKRLVDQVFESSQNPYIIDVSTGTERVLLPVSAVNPMRPIDTNLPEEVAILTALPDMGHPLARTLSA